MSRAGYLTLAGATGISLAFSVAAPVHAQIPLPPTTSSETDFRSVRVGPLLVTPTLAAGIGYDDNIASQPTSRRSDGVMRFAPTATASSDWSRHAFFGEATVEPFVYFNNSRLNDFNARVLGTGRLDLQRGATLSTSASFFRSADSGISPITSAALPGGGFGLQNFEPVISNRYSFDTRYQQQFNRYQLSGSFGYQRTTYEQAQNAISFLNQAQRDGDTYTLALRAGYNIRSGITLFGEGSYNIRRFRQASFDSEGFRTLVGAAFDITNVLGGEAYVGFLQQSFSRGQGDRTGAAFGGNLRWTPTRRMVYTLQARRDIGDPSAIGQRPGVATTLRVSTDLELYRNLLFNVNYGFININYTNTPSDRIHTVALGPTWIVNRHARLSATYRYVNRQASFPNGDFERNLFLVQLRVGL